MISTRTARLFALPAAAALSLSLAQIPSGLASAAPATPAVTAGASTAQNPDAFVRAEAPRDAHAPVQATVTGGVPGESATVSAAHSGSRGSESYNLDEQFDTRGIAEVVLPAPSEGWYAGAYLLHSGSESGEASGFFNVTAEVGPTVPEIFVSPTKKPASPFDTAGVMVTGLQPGEQVSVSSTVPGPGNDIYSEERTLLADDQGVAQGEVLPVAGGFEHGRLYNLSASTETNTGTGRFLNP